MYLASDQINDSNFDHAYAEVTRILHPHQNLWIDSLQIKVIGINAPEAKAALEVMKKYPDRIPTRYHGRHFGGLSLDEAYIYALPLAASAAGLIPQTDNPGRRLFTAQVAWLSPDRNCYLPHDMSDGRVCWAKCRSRPAHCYLAGGGKLAAMVAMGMYR